MSRKINPYESNQIDEPEKGIPNPIWAELAMSPFGMPFVLTVFSITVLGLMRLFGY